MDLYKFGIKLFLHTSKDYSSQNFIPVFHKWIQDQAIPNHLLIDVADYSHIPDGPGVMLIAHEGHFSLDQENLQPGIMYMRKTELEGSFKVRFKKVLSTVIEAADRLHNNNINKEINFINNSFRFIANDRLYAENTIENQALCKNNIKKVLNEIYPDSNIEFDDVSNNNERLAFTVQLSENINILK